MHVGTCICMHVCMCAYVYVCMFIRVCIIILAGQRGEGH